MTSDAVYTATCDADGCDYGEEIQPEVFHRDYSGNTPFVDLSDSAVNAELAKAGWSKDGEKDICPDCTEERKEAKEA